MFNSLRSRLWLTYALVVGVVITIAVVAVVVYLLRNPAEDRREIQRLRLISSLFSQRSQLLNLPPGVFASPRLQEAVERVDNTLGVRILIFDSLGKLLADSRPDQASILPDWSILRRRGQTGAGIFRDAGRKQWLYTMMALENGSYLMIAAPRAKAPVLGIMRDEFLWPFLRAVLLALFLSLILAFWIARWITAPLQNMAIAARAISEGNFQRVPPNNGPGEVKAVVRAFNEMGERMQASQRSQRDFIANVSHDLKTPLTSIQGFAQAILDGTADDPQAAQQAAEVIYSESERMHRMVLDLLELARLDSGAVAFERTLVDVGKLLYHVVQQFTPQAQQAQVSLKLIFGEMEGDTLPGGFLPAIHGDADRLAQVFSNLIDNAVKHTPPNGHVTVSAQPAGAWLEVQVADSGPGIPPDELERIFERFYQTDKSRQGGGGRGVGLGLAIAREIVRSHGGEISAHNLSKPDAGAAGLSESEPRKSGSVFVVRLPLTRPGDENVSQQR
jgi:signal transduction histidine kinase